MLKNVIEFLTNPEYNTVAVASLSDFYIIIPVASITWVIINKNDLKCLYLDNKRSFFNCIKTNNSRKNKCVKISNRRGKIRKGYCFK